MLGCLVLLSFVGASLATSSLIIPPVRSTGDEAAIIFVPGAAIKGTAYRDTATAIQKASGLKLWVALTGNYTETFPNPLQVPSAVKNAISALKAHGMKSDNFIGVGHSLGGIFLEEYAKKSSLKAIVLMGSYITKGTKLGDYPIPVLTLSGELDGQARITRIAEEYSQLKDLQATKSDSMYKYPVINMKGTNHAEFASGPMPSEVTKYDLTAEVSIGDAHAMIGQHVNSFIVANLNVPLASVAEAKKNLSNAFVSSGLRFNPLLEVRGYDSDGTSSPWAVKGQQLFAEGNVGSVKVTNKIEKNPSFLESKPSLVKSGSTVSISTTALLDYNLNPIDISTIPVSPKEIDVKFKSGPAIEKALHGSAGSLASNETCKSLNERAIKLALSKSTPDAQRRYNKTGRPIFLENDHTYGSGIEWSSKGMKLKEEDSGLHIQSVALYTSTSSFLYAGMHYCKLLSPYRAMEWINVDSLRAKAPHSVTSVLG